MVKKPEEPGESTTGGLKHVDKLEKTTDNEH